MSTSWSSPKRNVFAGINSLRGALAAGMNARLIRLYNEQCSYPIQTKNNITDFRAYESYVGLYKTRNEIEADDSMPEFEKHLTLNYKTCFGSARAAKRYYETGVLDRGNFKGVGRAHLVKVEDIIMFWAKQRTKADRERAQHFTNQYIEGGTGDTRHFFDHYRLTREHSRWVTTKFKRKLWVVETLKEDERIKLGWLMLTSIGLLNAFTYPLKFIPKKSVLQMDKYKCVTYRIGDVINGVSIDFHIPKKFSFK